MTPSDILHSVYIRTTPARLAVISCLQTASSPLTVSQITTKVHQIKPAIDIATIYRALDILVKNQLINPVNLNEGKLRYELAGDHHHHLVCHQCHSITPIYNQCLTLDESQIARQYQFQVSSHHLEFFGLCHQCQLQLAKSSH